MRRRHQGGHLPSHIELRSPVLEVNLKVKVPSQDNSASLAIFTRENLVRLCMKSVSEVPDWELILKKRLEEGASLELAWRMDTYLDWVWWRQDVNGDDRGWDVLSGLALVQVCFRFGISAVSIPKVRFQCVWTGRKPRTPRSSNRGTYPSLYAHEGGRASGGTTIN